ncbi:MAG TPA: PilZ domain-containing protein, partial [Candidatus Dormibacteraeota bacterium]|nr:PilZ domain-containing protein [Candidatus Dormibacteraeota bacterium]
MPAQSAWDMTNTIEHPCSSPTPPERRQHPRRKIYDTCYIDLLDGANGGLVLDISETGFLLQSALKISDRALSRLRFQLPCSEQCIEACAKL